ncbi:coa dehydrogenase [Arthrobacter sp. Hiyo4]|nr:coa dehydrogenase [Arthrobacter sp. Hiyo4]
MTNPNLPPTVGVLGGGRMGAGIAHAFLINGANVLVVERDEASAEAAGNAWNPQPPRASNVEPPTATWMRWCRGSPSRSITTTSRTASWWWRPFLKTGT